MHISADCGATTNSPPVHIVSRLLKPIYHALYHQFAWTYDAVAWLVSMGYWNECILYITNFIKEGPVLEIGHGPGHLQGFLANQNLWTAGIDQSRQMSRIASRRVNKQGLVPHLVNGFAQSLPFSNSRFRWVSATFPSPYIFARESLSEIYRVLAPGGELIILLTAWFLGNGILKKFWAWVFNGALNPDTDLRSLQSRFEVLPWHVEVLTPAYKENRLLIIRCRKDLSI